MEKEKTYTVTDLMGITGLTRAAILKRARPFGYTKYCRYVLKRTSWGNYIKEFSFTESQVRTMGLDHELSAEAKARIIQNETADNIEKEGVLERLKRGHPLVTDERCFKLSWWPETIPSIFQDDED